LERLVENITDMNANCTWGGWSSSWPVHGVPELGINKRSPASNDAMLRASARPWALRWKRVLEER